jgi:hypothetical protein
MTGTLTTALPEPVTEVGLTAALTTSQLTRAAHVGAPPTAL